jgi:hypothetical protein
MEIDTASSWQRFDHVPLENQDMRLSKSGNRARRFARELSYDRANDYCTDQVFSISIEYNNKISNSSNQEEMIHFIKREEYDL